MVFIITDHSKIVTEDEAAEIEQAHFSESFTSFFKSLSKLDIRQGWLRIGSVDSNGGPVVQTGGLRILKSPWWRRKSGGQGIKPIPSENDPSNPPFVPNTDKTNDAPHRDLSI
tara:strand:+ start:817 stop:1155 length:339 start_codon:yes stop_codon:yes gene_type:complete